jgi:hypothetical protein
MNVAALGLREAGARIAADLDAASCTVQAGIPRAASRESTTPTATWP